MNEQEIENFAIFDMPAVVYIILDENKEIDIKELQEISTEHGGIPVLFRHKDDYYFSKYDFQNKLYYKKVNDHNDTNRELYNYIVSRGSGTIVNKKEIKKLAGVDFPCLVYRVLDENKKFDIEELKEVSKEHAFSPLLSKIGNDYYISIHDYGTEFSFQKVNNYKKNHKLYFYVTSKGKLSLFSNGPYENDPYGKCPYCRSNAEDLSSFLPIDKIYERENENQVVVGCKNVDCKQNPSWIHRE